MGESIGSVLGLCRERSMANRLVNVGIDAAQTPESLSFEPRSKQQKLKMILRITWINLIKVPETLALSLG
jgi:hypothetical protein